MSQRKIFLEQVRQSGASLNDVITWDGAGWVASPVDLGNPTFYSLTDAANYTVGDAHRVLKINSDGTGVEFGLVLGSAASQDSSYFALSGSVTASTLTQASGTLLGRSSTGTGAIEELTLGTGLTLIDGVLSSTGGGSASYPDFTGNNGKVLAVNATEDGVEWVNQIMGSAGSGTNWSDSVTAAGTGAPQDITLPESGLSESDVLVFINGIRYETDEYVINGTTLTITSNSAGDSIEIVKVATSEVTPASEVSTFQGARVGRSANLAVGSPAPIPWTVESYDYGDWHDNATNNTRLVVPVGVNRVRITGQVEVQSPSGGQSFQIRKNGTATQIATAQVGNSAYTFTVIHIDTGIIEVQAGDYFEMYCEGNSTMLPGRSFYAIEAITEQLVASDLSITINGQTGTAYSLQLVDNNGIVEMQGSSPSTVTIPNNSTASMPVGTSISVIQIGTGSVTIQAAAGVTINGTSEGSATLTGQWSSASLYKRTTDGWVIQGDHGGVA